MFLQVFLLSVVIVGLAVAGFAIKMFFIKGAMFKKQCSSSIKDHKGNNLECAGGGSCHNPVVEEINYQRNTATSRFNIKKIQDAAVSE